MGITDVKAGLKAAILKLISNWPLLAAISAGLLSLVFLLIYIDVPILEMHGFRQTQTALTAYWLRENGFSWSYETPVAGFPWAIPMEFPFYQLLTVGINQSLGLSLEVSGRLVSWFSLIGCAYPVWKTGKLLKLPKETVYIFCALLWTHPVYFFWGRTFTIETNTLFFTLMAVPYGVKLANGNYSLRDWLFFVFWTSLGLLQKVTTAIPVYIVVFIYTLYGWSKNRPDDWKKNVLQVIPAYAVPMTLATFWTMYTDQVKQVNPLQLTSSNLKEVYLGTFAQRLNMDTLSTIFLERALLGPVGGCIFLLTIVAGIYVLPKKNKLLLITSLVLFGLPVFLFINVHHWHNYYQVANIYAMLIPISLLAGFYTSKDMKHHIRIIAFFLTLGFMLYQMYGFGKDYLPCLRGRDWRNHPVLVAADFIKKCTKENQALVIYGADWSSETAFYAQRKCFTVPGWYPRFEQAWENPEMFTGNLPVGALVFYNNQTALRNKNPLDHPFVKKENIHYFTQNRDLVCLVNQTSICR